MDEYIKAEMARQRIPGLSLAVVRDGKLIKAQGYGLADIEAKVPAAPDTVYELASMTKPFVALDIMRLVERGKVGLDDPASRYLDGLPDAWSSITARHLLTHTSGLVDCENKPTIDETKDYTVEQILRSLFDQPLEFEPGTNFFYSNSNYLILGMIIHKVSGKTWGRFLRDEMLVPLGMGDIQVNGAPGASRLAVGYSLKSGEPKRGDPIALTVLATAYGGLRSTVLDLVKWDIALDAGQIVKPFTLQQMWMPTELVGGGSSGYGLGWIIGRQNGRLCVSHGGARTTGFASMIAKYPDDGLTVIVLTNGFPVDTMHIAERIAGLQSQ